MKLNAIILKEKRSSNSMFEKLQGNTLRSDTTLKYREKNSLRFFALHWFIQFQFGWFLCLSVYAIYENIFNWQRSHWPAVLTEQKQQFQVILDSDHNFEGRIRQIWTNFTLSRLGEVFSYSYSHSTMRHGQPTISNLNGEMMRKIKTIIVPEMVSQITPSTYYLPCVWRVQEVGCMLGVDTQSGVLTTTETRLGVRTLHAHTDSSSVNIIVRCVDTAAYILCRYFLV